MLNDVRPGSVDVEAICIPQQVTPRNGLRAKALQSKAPRPVLHDEGKLSVGSETLTGCRLHFDTGVGWRLRNLPSLLAPLLKQPEPVAGSPLSYLDVPIFMWCDH